MQQADAEKFAAEWIAAWNAHDLEKILIHYEDAFEMTSPAIQSLAGQTSGRLVGKKSVREYWAAALQKYPDLKFTMLHVLAGVNTTTIVYHSVLGLSAETFHFSNRGKVIRAFAHYKNV
jgi:hypothetical protein